MMTWEQLPAYEDFCLHYCAYSELSISCWKIAYFSAEDTSRSSEPASGSYLKVLLTLLLQQNEDFHPGSFSSQYWPMVVSTSTWMWGPGIPNLEQHESVTQNSTSVSNPGNIFGHAFIVVTWNSGPSSVMVIKFKVPDPNSGCTSSSMSSIYDQGASYVSLGLKRSRKIQCGCVSPKGKTLLRLIFPCLDKKMVFLLYLCLSTYLVSIIFFLPETLSAKLICQIWFHLGHFSQCICRPRTPIQSWIGNIHYLFL